MCRESTAFVLPGTTTVVLAGYLFQLQLFMTTVPTYVQGSATLGSGVANSNGWSRRSCLLCRNECAYLGDCGLDAGAAFLDSFGSALKLKQAYVADPG